MGASATRIWTVAILASFLSATVASAEPAVITSDPSSLSDEDLDRRVAWLTSQLDDGARYAKIWQYGWASGYTLGIGIGTAQAIATNDSDTRINAIVTASKGAIGTTRILWAPHPGRLGADPIRTVGGNDRASRLRQLAIGETQLMRVAKRADQRRRWQRHAGNVLLNAIGGAVVLGFGDATDAAISAAVGIAVGELMIFSSPSRADSDLRAYRQRFAGAPRSRWQVSLVPTPNGAKIRVDF